MLEVLKKKKLRKLLWKKLRKRDFEENLKKIISKESEKNLQKKFENLENIKMLRCWKIA